MNLSYLFLAFIHKFGWESFLTGLCTSLKDLKDYEVFETLSDEEKRFIIDGITSFYQAKNSLWRKEEERIIAERKEKG